MTKLRLLPVLLSMIMLVLAPVLPCAMGNSKAAASTVTATMVQHSSPDSCCAEHTQRPASCPAHSQESSHQPVMRCCCGPSVATAPAKVVIDRELLVSPILVI